MTISILLITYNHSQYILQAIDSILFQCIDCASEIILLDDCSADDTFAKASSKLEGRSNVKLVRNEENLGITKNYQKGFSMCTGEYVFVIEGDDYWIDRDKVQKQITFMNAHPYHSMCFHSYLIQQGTSSSFFKREANVEYSDSFSVTDLILNEGLIGNFSVCCYRKKYLDQLPEELFNHLSYDWIVNMFMGHFGLLGRLNDEMSVYRHAVDASWSNKSLKDKLEKTIDLIPLYDKLLDYKYSSVFKRKIEMLNQQIAPPKTEQWWRKWVPPVVIKILKLMIPPILIR